MLTPSPPDPATFELGVESPNYKKALVAWKARKQDEREHPENYGEVATKGKVVTAEELSVVQGRLADALRRVSELEKRKP